MLVWTYCSPKCMEPFWVYFPMLVRSLCYGIKIFSELFRNVRWDIPPFFGLRKVTKIFLHLL